jgi:two-component system, OmpR family, sensor histidine kinase KdpD
MSDDARLPSAEPRGRQLALRDRRPSPAAGVVVAVLAVAASTAIIYPLKSVAPAVALGVVYLVAVLIVSAYWGLALGLATALLSAAAFNFFHIAPVGRFTISDSRNWVALAAFAVVAAFTSTVADLARARALEAERGRREADLTAALARALLGGTDTASALHDAAGRVGEALGVREVGIALGSVEPARRQRAIALSDGDLAATLLVPERLEPAAEEALDRRIVPSLRALIAVALARDALQTEAVETAALRRSDELKTALLRAVSHDLRTPLTGILTAGHAVASDSLSDTERHELSAAIVEEGTRLSNLIDKLLDLSRLQAGRAEPRLGPASLDEVLDAAREAVGNGAVFRFAIDQDLPLLRADAAQLERAFANVLENAARHSAGQPVSVRARVVGSRLMVRVVDRGPGVPATEQERIFEPFYRAPGADPQHAGAGLGLAIAKGFIEANGGHIWVESLPGQGTSFVVEFTLEQQHVSAPA